MQNQILENYLSKFGEVAGMTMNRCYMDGDRVEQQPQWYTYSLREVSFTSKDDQIPNFIKFGKNTVMFTYAGQEKTCR